MAVDSSFFNLRNGLRFAVAALAGSVLGANLYLMSELSHLKSQMGIVQIDLGASRNEISNLKSTWASADEAADQSLKSIREELQAARAEAETAVGEVKAAATRRAGNLSAELAKKLAREQARNEKLQTQLKRDISKVEEATQTANVRIGDVKTDVVAVRSEVADNRTELQKAVADLRRVKGDLGFQSGQIATNQKELMALKALGDKSYYDFDLKGKQPITVGGANLTLKKTDAKKFRFTLDVLVNDKKVEKKDRVINEPVQFLVKKVRQPYALEVAELYEIVVNEVGKGNVKGYLAVPHAPSL